MNFDAKRISFFVITTCASLAVAYFGQPLIHDNKDATGVIVNVFSILAGFLVAIMTLLGDPSMFGGKSWRSDAVKRNNVYKRLVRHKWLFVTYLLVLGLVFVSTLITKKYPDGDLVIWIERSYLALAFYAFVMSLILPSRLMSLQLARFDEIVNERKQK
ncbi:hypothetical protein [uncultured Alteromonas sp.]|uniref:hypothetical protein n=1 Tax=uncultured Alteromonas sp. TaxID=179113 RepID=UPI0030D8E8D2